MRIHFEENVKVEFHLNGGYTRLLLIRYKNNGQAFPYIDIPTKDIPNNLKKMGSHFVLIINKDDSIEIKE